MKNRGLGSNGVGSLIFHTLFTLFIISPLVVIVLVSFSDKGYISMPFDGASLRWYWAILSAPELVNAFLLSFWLGLGVGNRRLDRGSSGSHCYRAIPLCRT